MIKLINILKEIIVNEANYLGGHSIPEEEKWKIHVKDISKFKAYTPYTVEKNKDTGKDTVIEKPFTLYLTDEDMGIWDVSYINSDPNPSNNTIDYYKLEKDPKQRALAADFITRVLSDYVLPMMENDTIKVLHYFPMPSEDNHRERLFASWFYLLGKKTNNKYVEKSPRYGKEVYIYKKENEEQLPDKIKRILQLP